MRIALLTDGIFPFVVGGMQRHSSYLAAHLALRGHEITLVHAIPWNKPLPGDAEVQQALQLPEGVTVRNLPVHFPKPGFLPGHYLKESYLYSRTIAEKLKNEWNSFDFIYAKGFSAWHLLHEKSKGRNLPPVGVKFHGYEMFQQGAGLRSKLEAMMLRGPVKWINQQADVIFSYGGKITPLILSLGIPSSRIAEISSGIDASWLRTPAPPIHQGKRRFIFIGRNERRKGIEELHQAVGRLSADIEMHIVGPFPHSMRLKDKRVNYHGALTAGDELRSVLDGGQVLVLPSWSEGMPNVILEAMSRGLAVIATDVGAVSELVTDANGWLIAPGSVDALSEAMSRAAEVSDDMLHQKRLASLHRVREQFTWPIVAAKVEAAIQGAVSRRG